MSTDLMNRISQLAQNAIGTLRVKSALNPFLWACVVIGGLCFTAAYALRQNTFIESVLVIAGISPIPVLLGVGIYFAIRKPDKLQSEEYQLREQSLKLILERGGKLHVDKASIENIVIAPLDQPKQLPKSSSITEKSK